MPGPPTLTCSLPTGWTCGATFIAEFGAKVDESEAPTRKWVRPKPPTEEEHVG